MVDLAVNNGIDVGQAIELDKDLSLGRKESWERQEM